MKKHYLVNFNAVLPDQVIRDASVLIEDGIISAICPESASSTIEIDLMGQTVIPGMIDLHCDAIEKVIEPRPNVKFPVDVTLLQIDRRFACAGITTPFQSLSFSSEELGLRDTEFETEIIKSVKAMQGNSMVDHKIHIRYEVTDPACVPAVELLVEDGFVDLLSFMDHTPGQGQFQQKEDFMAYLRRITKQDDDTLSAVIDEKYINQKNKDERVDRLAKFALAHKVPIASHDDDTVEIVEKHHQLGITVAEFPMNHKTAKASKEAGMLVMYGAPNAVRGKSQSNGVNVREAVSLGLVDCLCSDYFPEVLLWGAYTLYKHQLATFPHAVNMVTMNPAHSVGLYDRGELAVGKRADLVVFYERDNRPILSQCWCNGRQVIAYDQNEMNQLSTT